MRSLFGVFAAFAGQAMMDIAETSSKNKEKMEEARQRWLNSVKYPRKKKKKEKKIAQQDYNFWATMDKWCKETMGDFDF